MSHFVVTVIVPNELLGDNEAISSYIDEKLAPFDESISVEPYPDVTLEKAAEKKRKRLEEYKNNLESLNPPEHWLKPGGYFDHAKEEIKRLSKLSDEDYFKELAQGYQEYNEKGEPLTTYNPNSQWDWYRVGGRWDGWLTDNEKDDGQGGFNFGDEFQSVENNLVPVKVAIEKTKIPFAVVTPDGEWIQRGKMGWWGIATDEADSDLWAMQVIGSIYEKYKDGYSLVSVDCHI